MPKPPCTGVLKPVPIYQKLMVENLTIVRPPILKIYYWESFDISGWNKKLKSNRQEHEHTIEFPTRHIESPPQKILFWLRNLSSKPMTLTLKRIQNCCCKPVQTRVGFNQFRKLFHCRHRKLLHLQQEVLTIKPDEVVALSVTAYFQIYGEHLLSYKVHTDDNRKFLWHFHLHVSELNPEKCLLTKELLPVNIKNYYHVTQPIWVQNFTNLHLNFSFSTRDRSLKLLNTNLTVPRQSVWPLLVDYRPMDYENEVEVLLGNESATAWYKIKGRGVLVDEEEETDMPLKDHECADFLYVIYPNRVVFEVCLKEDRTQLVNVHNFGQKCVEFRWQNYIISEFFSVSFTPPLFRLKGHHSKLVEVKVTAYDRLVNFRRIPIVLEVHRNLDQATLIAKRELDEIESIDDPKWKEDSYITHVYLHLNIRSTHKSTQEAVGEIDEATDTAAERSPCGGGGIEITAGAGGDGPATEEQRMETERRELIKRLAAKQKLTSNEIIELTMAIDNRNTIFEKLFWKYLCKSNFMRIFPDRKRHKHTKTYDEVVSVRADSPPELGVDADRNTIMEILSRLMQESINDLARNWVFIPSQYYERNL
ncbi:uncharacterized protein LOC108164186 [Drosophila miranda]|uniref:uncharacterized protein LOC108164186 n=1 Tax=Drosophila miranda TaxID=7229 RepID=UPI0007E642B4|nr:uncharacterized protein LOC108164186 [Drosophila miranda]